MLLILVQVESINQLVLYNEKRDRTNQKTNRMLAR